MGFSANEPCTASFLVHLSQLAKKCQSVYTLCCEAFLKCANEGLTLTYPIAHGYEPLVGL